MKRLTPDAQNGRGLYAAEPEMHSMPSSNHGRTLSSGPHSAAPP